MSRIITVIALLLALPIVVREAHAQGSSQQITGKWKLTAIASNNAP